MDEGKIVLPFSNNILQINELIEVLGKDSINWGLFCKLFLEMFEDLIIQPIALYCVEISRFCFCCTDSDMIDLFHDDIIDVIYDGTGIYIHPEKFWPFTPEKVLQKALKLTEKYPSSPSQKTNKERILEMHKKNLTISHIAKELKITEELVKKTYNLQRFKNQGFSDGPALEKYSLWFHDICGSKSSK